jgi:hypothetical protein
MIGEFLLEVTFFQATVVVLVYVVFLAILAYKKPSWYANALRIYAIIFMYSLGWENAIEHHDIPYLEQSNIESYSILGYFCLIMLIDNLWFDPMVKNRLEESKSEEEA